MQGLGLNRRDNKGIWHSCASCQNQCRGGGCKTCSQDAVETGLGGHLSCFPFSIMPTMINYTARTALVGRGRLSNICPKGAAFKPHHVSCFHYPSPIHRLLRPVFISLIPTGVFSMPTLDHSPEEWASTISVAPFFHIPCPPNLTHLRFQSQSSLNIVLLLQDK